VAAIEKVSLQQISFQGFGFFLSYFPSLFIFWLWRGTQKQNIKTR